MNFTSREVHKNSTTDVGDGVCVTYTRSKVQHFHNMRVSKIKMHATLLKKNREQYRFNSLKVDSAIISHVGELGTKAHSGTPVQTLLQALHCHWAGMGIVPLAIQLPLTTISCNRHFSFVVLSHKTIFGHAN